MQRNMSKVAQSRSQSKSASSGRRMRLNCSFIRKPNYSKFQPKAKIKYATVEAGKPHKQLKKNFFKTSQGRRMKNKSTYWVNHKWPHMTPQKTVKSEISHKQVETPSKLTKPPKLRRAPVAKGLTVNLYQDLPRGSKRSTSKNSAKRLLDPTRPASKISNAESGRQWVRPSVKKRTLEAELRLSAKAQASRMASISPKQAVFSGSKLFDEILLKNFASLRSQTERFNRFQKLRRGNIMGDFSENLEKRIQNICKRKSHSTKKAPKNAEKLKKVRSFFAGKRGNKLKTLSKCDIKFLYTFQLMMNIPYGAVKSYFGGFTGDSEKKGSGQSRCADAFLDTIKSQVKAVSTQFQDREMNPAKMIASVKKTQNFRPFEGYSPNQRIEFDQRKRENLQQIADFGVDIYLREHFFDQKIKPEHLKNKNKVKQASPGCAPRWIQRPRRTRSIQLQNSEFVDLKDFDDSQQQTDLILSRDICSVRDGNAQIYQAPAQTLRAFRKGPSDETSESKTTELDSQRKATINSNIGIGAGGRGAGVKRIVVGSSGWHNIRESSRKSGILYSFRDDTTIGNYTQANEEFEMIRLNSKSILELSKFDWSVSHMTKNQSANNIVGPL